MRPFAQFALACCLIPPSISSAGPPFVTDDPEPVETGHFELNIAAQYARESGGASWSIPRAELNYGPCKDVQTGITLPLEIDDPSGSGSKAGPGDIELSLKYRFIQETENIPMVAFFPSVSLPTGDESKGLGAGKAALFLPVWFQKSWDTNKWTTYGGGGWSLNPAGDDFWRAGWLVERHLTEKLMLGGELFFETANAPDASDHLGFDLGGTFVFTDHTRLLFAAGRDITGPNRFSGYLGIQLTW